MWHWVSLVSQASTAGTWSGEESVSPGCRSWDLLGSRIGAGPQPRLEPPKHPWKWHWSQSLACSQDSSGCIPWEEEEDFPDQTPPMSSLSCMDQEKSGEEVQPSAGRGRGKEQDTGGRGVGSCKCPLVPSGLGGEAEEAAAATANPGNGEDPGALRGARPPQLMGSYSE